MLYESLLSFEYVQTRTKNELSYHILRNNNFRSLSYHTEVFH